MCICINIYIYIYTYIYIYKYLLALIVGVITSSDSKLLARKSDTQLDFSSVSSTNHKDP